MRDIHKLVVVLLSTLISGLGMSSFLIAANWFIEHIDNTSFYVAAANALCYFTVLAVLPHIGNICDKCSRKKILVSVYFIGVVIQLFMCVLADKLSNIGLIMVLITASSVITAIKASDQVCRTSYLQNVVDKKYYQLSNQWLEAVRQGITFIGGGATVLLMKSPSLLMVLYFNVITFIFGMVLISILPNDSVSINTNHQVSKLSYFEKFKSGLNVLRTFDNQLIYTLLISILPYALVVSISVTYPALFKSLSINHEAEFYAALSIPYGAGALFASIINRKTSQNFDKFFTVHSGIFILALIIGALSQNVYVIYGVLFVIAYCHAAIRVQRNTIIMNRVDNHDISKLLSFFEIIFTLLVIILSFILGYLCDHFSAVMSWIFLAVMFSMLIAIFLFNNVRHAVKI